MGVTSVFCKVIHPVVLIGNDYFYKLGGRETWTDKVYLVKLGLMSLVNERTKMIFPEMVTYS